ncbi:MAG: glycosyltransferase family 9 protein [Nitrospirae bacterium]|nr:glycosyltransferase family 9 protein [Nitrospirota bacterium]
MMNLTALKNDIKNILLIRRNNIGDMICAIPVFKSIRKEFPKAHITVLADITNAGILKGASFIDDVLIYKKGQGIYKNKYMNYWRLFKENKRTFDLAIALKVGVSSTSALITLISRARIRAGGVPEKWHPLQLCYNLPVKGWKKWKSIPHVDALLTFINALGIEKTVKDISIEAAPDSKAKVRKFFEETLMFHSNTNDIEKNPPSPMDNPPTSPFDKGGQRGIFKGGRGGFSEINNIVVFNISSNKPENTWPLHKFKELGDLLNQRYKAMTIITSTTSDKDNAINLSGEIAGRAFYFETPEVMDFAALVAKAKILICGEGGAMHVGAAVNTPTISLWGRLRPKKWHPFGDKQFVVKKGEHVDSISADDVLEVIRENKLLK